MCNDTYETEVTAMFCITVQSKMGHPHDGGLSKLVDITVIFVCVGPLYDVYILDNCVPESQGCLW